MTNKKIISLVLGIMCFALTAGICIQVKTVNNINSKVSQNYEENNLRSEVLKYKEKYDNLLREIDEIDEQLLKEIDKATSNNSELEEANKKIIEGNKTIGLSEVNGTGVIITISDSDIDQNSVFDTSDLLVHDKDILKIVNELKNAGAEAISINEQRIVNMSDIVYVNNSIIYVNQQRILAPYVIKAIGDSVTLESTLLGNGGYVETLKNIGFDVDIQRQSKVNIPHYNKEIGNKYIQ